MTSIVSEFRSRPSMTLVFLFGLAMQCPFVATEAARGAEIVVQVGHGGQGDAVECGTVAPHRERLASGASDGTIALWDLRTGAMFRRIVAHSAGVRGMAFTDQGDKLLSIDWAGHVSVWDVASGRCLRSIVEVPGKAVPAAISPDGSHIATGARTELHLWETGTGRLARRLSMDATTSCVAFAVDGKSIWCGAEDGSVKVWDAATGELLHAEKVYSSKRRDGRVLSIAVSPDGEVAAASWAERAAKAPADSFFDAADPPEFKAIVWDARSFRRIGRFDIATPADSLAVRWRAKRLIAERRLWDLDARKEIGVAERLKISAGGCGPGCTPNGCQSIALSSDGRQLAVGVGLTNPTVAEIWIVDTATWRKLQVLHWQVPPVESLAADPFENRILISTTSCWSPFLVEGKKREPFQPLGKPLTPFDYSIGAPQVAWSRDGKFVVGGYQEELDVWDAATRRPLHAIRRPFQCFEGASFSSDGTLIATRWSMSSDVDVWDLRSDRLFRRCGNVVKHRPQSLVRGLGTFWREVQAIAWSPRGRILAASNDNMVILHDVESGRELRRLDAGQRELVSLAFSADGKTIAAGATNGEVVLLAVDDGRQLGVLPVGRDRVSVLQFTRDGAILVAGSANGTASTWDWKSRKLLRSFSAESFISSLALLADGRRLVTGSYDGGVRIWDLQSGSMAATLFTFNNAEDWLVFSPNGNYDGSARAREKYVRFRDPHDAMKVVPPDQGFADRHHPNLLAEVLGVKK